MRRPYIPFVVALILVFGGLPSRARAEEGSQDNPLEPSPHATAEAALADVRRRIRNQTAESSAPRDVDVVGAITRRPGGRLGFMPLLQHHMAVEHWFVTGLDEAKLTEALAGGTRCFVRIRGDQTLFGVFGGSPLEFYGTGLEHGVEWGPVMGYHERVYRLRIRELVWARTRAELAEARSRQAALMRKIDGLSKALDYEGARRGLEEAVELARDGGLETRGPEGKLDYATRMVTLTASPRAWNEADRQTVAEALVFQPAQPFKELGPKAKGHLIQVVGAWPEEIRNILGPLVVDAWLALEYRYQRDKSRAVVSALEVPATEAWRTKLLDAEARVAEAKQRLAALREAHDYAGMIDAIEALMPHQAWVLDYALADDRTKLWLPAARRLVALEAVFSDRNARRELLLSQVRETIASKTGLPNSHEKPRYNEELLARFGPRLSEDERSAVEALLLEIVEPLDARENWREILLGAELLSGFGRDPARAFFPQLLRRTRGSPQWQRTHLQAYAAALGD